MLSALKYCCTPGGIPKVASQEGNCEDIIPNEMLFVSITMKNLNLENLLETRKSKLEG